MSVTYSTNWMGPVNMKWYSDRGLTRKVSKLLEEDQRFGDLKAGDTWTYDEITTEYACGRIDIRGLDPEKYWNGWYQKVNEEKKYRLADLDKNFWSSMLEDPGFHEFVEKMYQIGHKNDITLDLEEEVI